MTATQRTRKRRSSILLTLVLCSCLPALAGGCPDFRNSVVDALESATVTVLASGAPAEDAADTAGRGLLTAALSLLFDRFRTDGQP